MTWKDNLVMELNNMQLHNLHETVIFCPSREIETSLIPQALYCSAVVVCHTADGVVCKVQGTGSVGSGPC